MKWPAAQVVVHDEHRPTQLPEVFVQWKNTDVCFDFWCPRGQVGHFDGYFAYQSKCSACLRTFAMPNTVYPANIGVPMDDCAGAVTVQMEGTEGEACADPRVP